MGETGESDGPRLDAGAAGPGSIFAIAERPAPAGVVLLALEGEFDLAAAPSARDRFAQAGARRPRSVVLDMAAVTFADSSALRELLRADAALRSEGARLVIAAASPPVERVLDLTLARELLELAPTVEQALQRATA
jgi:anti-sigma B factor antagonist